MKASDSTDLGDQDAIIALASITKAILSYTTGKRDVENSRAFVTDLRARVVNQPSISTDGFTRHPVDWRGVLSGPLRPDREELLSRR